MHIYGGIRFFRENRRKEKTKIAYLWRKKIERKQEKKTKIAYLWRNKIERKQEKRKNKDCIFMEE